MLAAGDCAMMEALHFTQRKSAQIVRAAISAHQASALWRARTGRRRELTQYDSDS